MRILHVVPTYLPATRYGGPIYSVHGLCVALAKLGHDVHVATTSVDGARDSDVPHGEAVALDGVKVWYFRSRYLRRLYYSPPLRDALAGMIHGFDLIHLHSVFLWPTSTAARLAARARIPYVVSPRGMLVRELIERQSRGVKTAWLTLIESETLGGAASVHMTSERELADARKLPLPLPSPFIVPNGVQPPRPEYAARASDRVRRLSDGPPYALYLGRIHWKKGLDRVLSALAGTGIRLVICGNDEDNYKPELERIVRERRFQDRVHFEAPVAGDDKWALLARARFVVLASYNENFGNVVTEAMAVGRPVIVTEEVGAAEVLRESAGGLVSAGSAEALRDGMLRLWNDDLLASQLGERGRRFAEDHLTWSRVGERMADRYAILVAAAAERARPAADRVRPTSVVRR